MIITVKQDEQATAGPHVVFKSGIAWSLVFMTLCCLALSLACLLAAEPRETSLLAGKIFLAVTLILLPFAGSFWTVRFNKDLRTMEATRRILWWTVTRKTHPYDELSLGAYHFKYFYQSADSGSGPYSSTSEIAVKAGARYYQLIMAPSLYMTAEALPRVRHFLGFPADTGGQD